MEESTAGSGYFFYLPFVSRGVKRDARGGTSESGDASELSRRVSPLCLSSALESSTRTTLKTGTGSVSFEAARTVAMQDRSAETAYHSATVLLRHTRVRRNSAFRRPGNAARFAGARKLSLSPCSELDADKRREDRFGRCPIPCAHARWAISATGGEERVTFCEARRRVSSTHTPPCFDRNEQVAALGIACRSARGHL